MPCPLAVAADLLLGSLDLLEHANNLGHLIEGLRTLAEIHQRCNDRHLSIIGVELLNDVSFLLRCLGLRCFPCLLLSLSESWLLLILHRDKREILVKL